MCCLDRFLSAWLRLSRPGSRRGVVVGLRDRRQRKEWLLLSFSFLVSPPTPSASPRPPPALPPPYLNLLNSPSATLTSSSPPAENNYPAALPPSCSIPYRPSEHPMPSSSLELLRQQFARGLWDTPIRQRRRKKGFRWVRKGNGKGHFAETWKTSRLRGRIGGAQGIGGLLKGLVVCLWTLKRAVLGV